MEVELTRGRGGHEPLTALTRIDLGFDRRRLVISTSRHNGGLATTAYVGTVSPDGLSLARAYGKSGDFRSIIAEAPGKRATEKSVLDLHGTALLAIETVTKQALAHYGKSAA